MHKQGYLDAGLVEEKEGLKFVRTFPLQKCLDPNTMRVHKTGPIDVYYDA